MDQNGLDNVDEMLQNMKAGIQNIDRSVSNKIPKLMELYDLNGVLRLTLEMVAVVGGVKIPK